MLCCTLQVPLSMLARDLQVFAHQCQGGHTRSFLMTGTSQAKAKKLCTNYGGQVQNYFTSIHEQR